MWHFHDFLLAGTYQSVSTPSTDGPPEVDQQITSHINLEHSFEETHQVPVAEGCDNHNLLRLNILNFIINILFPTSRVRSRFWRRLWRKLWLWLLLWKWIGNIWLWRFKFSEWWWVSCGWPSRSTWTTYSRRTIESKFSWLGSNVQNQTNPCYQASTHPASASGFLTLGCRDVVENNANCKKKDIPPGKYYHFGLAAGAKRSLASLDYSIAPKRIGIVVNIDGLPFTKSTSNQFWPISWKIAERWKFSPESSAAVS